MTTARHDESSESSESSHTHTHKRRRRAKFRSNSSDTLSSSDDDVETKTQGGRSRGAITEEKSKVFDWQPLLDRIDGAPCTVVVEGSLVNFDGEIVTTCTRGVEAHDPDINELFVLPLTS
eukprot:GHVR01058019.1.p1 GENE.GHVR01058019.1~~GHVR01058019.1.p1  ORF type:complete len:120 (-),score=48.32 GHVR01058019.1:35-394(-)